MVDNNITESFNAWILGARTKPIISMLDDIRIKVMERMKDKRVHGAKLNSEFTNDCMTYFHDNKLASLGCKVVFNGDDGFEIGDGADRHTVFLDKQLCTCRAWELTGIPCAHAIRALEYSKIDPFTVISPWYHKKTFQASYQFPLMPIPGKRFMQTENFQPIEAPPLIKLAGRPRIKRVRASNEPNPTSKVEKLSKKGFKQQCGICKGEGHNRINCPNKGNSI